MSFHNHIRLLSIPLFSFNDDEIYDVRVRTVSKLAYNFQYNSLQIVLLFEVALANKFARIATQTNV